ncbi:nitrate- and nitrite sensing domain-containing protein [Teredinibacter purpureus]|uniref:nitrate- and nitrite sensing domain-containing protein n=1 Tax=Teredinibacter purpureus TaxID=2731756 RepID=UPI0005F7F818|nr:nitrate- and nitrite sensing domain-containing protein [Teredinibacter purpureus]
MNASYTFVVWLSSSIFILSLLALALMHRERYRVNFLTAVQLLQAGRILLVHLQRHRGLSAAKIAGCEQRVSELPELRCCIVEDMAKMAALNEWLSENENWHGITRHWAALSVTCEALSVDASFDQHSRLIASLIELLNEIAAYFKVDDHPRYSDTRIMWKELLHTGEIIGQCRALGVHVLAGNLTLTELIKYRKNIENIVTTITVYLESPACQRHLSGQCKVCVEQFLTFLREQLFEGDCDLSAIEYFNFASDVIEIVYEQYDIEMLRLHRRIE